MVDAMRLAFDALKLALEPAGAAATAALLGPVARAARRPARGRAGVRLEHRPRGLRAPGRRAGLGWIVARDALGRRATMAGAGWGGGSTRARAATPADLVVRDARILNTATGTLDPPATSPSAATRSSARTTATAAGARSTPAAGSWHPGFIDTHVHIESSLVLPAEFEQGRAAARHDDGDLRSRTRSPTCWAWPASATSSRRARASP